MEHLASLPHKALPTHANTNLTLYNQNFKLCQLVWKVHSRVTVKVSPPLLKFNMLKALQLISYWHTVPFPPIPWAAQGSSVWISFSWPSWVIVPKMPAQMIDSSTVCILSIMNVSCVSQVVWDVRWQRNMAIFSAPHYGVFTPGCSERDLKATSCPREGGTPSPER